MSTDATASTTATSPTLPENPATKAASLRAADLGKGGKAYTGKVYGSGIDADKRASKHLGDGAAAKTSRPTFQEGKESRFVRTSAL